MYDKWPKEKDATREKVRNFVETTWENHPKQRKERIKRILVKRALRNEANG